MFAIYATGSVIPKLVNITKVVYIHSIFAVVF